MTHNEQLELFGACRCICHQRRVLNTRCECGWLLFFPGEALQESRRTVRPTKLESRVQAFQGNYYRGPANRNRMAEKQRLAAQKEQQYGNHRRGDRPVHQAQRGHG